MKKIIASPLAPKAVGPYSQAVEAGSTLYISGQLPIDAATGSMPETIEEQTHRVCRNLQAVLSAAGSSLTDVLKTVCFLSDMADFAAFNQVYAQYFTDKPARSCVAVKALPKGALVEVEAVAKRSE